MQGLDVAFYKNRAFYHTPRDSIPGMGYGAGKRALWAMLETARGAGLALLNDDATADDDGSLGVYFDRAYYAGSFDVGSAEHMLLFAQCSARSWCCSRWARYLW